MSATARAEARRKAILSRGTDRLSKLTTTARGEDAPAYLNAGECSDLTHMDSINILCRRYSSQSCSCQLCGRGAEHASSARYATPVLFWKRRLWRSSTRPIRLVRRASKAVPSSSHGWRSQFSAISSASDLHCNLQRNICTSSR
jgi:hypothetical protein